MVTRENFHIRRYRVEFEIRFAIDSLRRNDDFQRVARETYAGRTQADGETPIVLWSHETGETEERAETFAEFVEKAKLGEYEAD